MDRDSADLPAGLRIARIEYGNVMMAAMLVWSLHDQPSRRMAGVQHLMSVQHLAVCDLSAALARMGKNVELLKSIVQFYREDSGVILRTLQQAVAARDFATVQRSAHSLRGLIASFGASAATQIALRLEEMGRSGQLTDAEVVLREFEHELERLDSTLTTELAKLEIAN